MDIQSRREWFGKVAWLGALSALFSSSASSQTTSSRRYVKTPGTQARAYSPAVITRGGSTMIGQPVLKRKTALEIGQNRASAVFTYQSTHNRA